MISPQSPDDKSRPARSVSDQRLSPDDPFRRANLPAIQPREEELQQLQRKKKELEEELAALRVSHLGLKLELEQERRRNAFWEERFFSTARSLGTWFEQAAFPMTCIDGDGRIIEANKK
ncbi:MAG TPA: hypothetical protein VK041_06650, partial [Opitutales bacterium]|nr:hypothetical protein [Opitutales bacterium]